MSLLRNLELFGTPATEDCEPFAFTAESVASPAAYDGVLAFHKYWGKKPVEPLSFIIERVTKRGDLVVDPFSGSGVTGFAAVGLNRRYLGIDINPIAVKLSSLVLSPPAASDLREAFAQISRKVKSEIESTYRTSTDHGFATHYLWNGDLMQEIWAVARRRRVETLEPSAFDIQMFKKYESYRPKFRSPRFFKNSRINSEPNLTWRDLFTGRALRNIELILDAVGELPGETRSALELCLTAGIGQMSKMVFAITGRGKKGGKESSRIEVGSWVIGFWRPPLHFEISVWNCFERKFDKLLSGVSSLEGRAKSGGLQDVINGMTDFSIVAGNAASVLAEIPDQSADLILTDPPHSDRAPYLELSELWNAVLGLEPSFEDEIVVSNAKDRQKHLGDYNARMRNVAAMMVRKLSKKGCIVVQFNARGPLSWEFLKAFESSVEGSGVSFRGTFPIKYSANSVVQDNRAGALTTDYALLFAPKTVDATQFSVLHGWTNNRPQRG